MAGLGIDDLQPPGSTFKMVTVTAALEAKVASLKSVFPYATSATLDGVKLENANGEDCGGSLALAFAVSCNSVFAPLGVKVGADRLVATAESFGFNHSPGLPGAVESTLPAGKPDPGRTGPWIDVDRTGTGTGLGAADGEDRGDRRRRRQTPDAHVRSATFHARARDERRHGAHRAAT